MPASGSRYLMAASAHLLIRSAAREHVLLIMPTTNTAREGEVRVAAGSGILRDLDAAYRKAHGGLVRPWYACSSLNRRSAG
jgi:hypothetical protein